MADDKIQETDSGVASSDVTPVNQETSPEIPAVDMDVLSAVAASVAESKSEEAKDKDTSTIAIPPPAAPTAAPAQIIYDEDEDEVSFCSPLASLMPMHLYYLNYFTLYSF